jgi:hypothetical protein
MKSVLYSFSDGRRSAVDWDEYTLALVGAGVSSLICGKPWMNGPAI